MTITASRSVRRRSLLVAGVVALGLAPSFVMQDDAKAEISNCGYVGTSITTVPLVEYCEPGWRSCNVNHGPAQVGDVRAYECLRVNP